MTGRARARVPPFNSNGGGYRDTLVWLSALGEAQELGADLVMVSGDKAFADKTTKGLHPALKAEALDRGVGASLASDGHVLATEHLRVTDVVAAAKERARRT